MGTRTQMLKKGRVEDDGDILNGSTKILLTLLRKNACSHNYKTSIPFLIFDIIKLFKLGTLFGYLSKSPKSYFQIRIT